MKKSALKLAGSLLIISSLVLVSWLGIGHMKAKEKQDHMMAAFHAVKAEGADVKGKTSADRGASNNRLHDMEGILTIPAIDLEYPVKYGADQGTLSQSLGAIEGLDPPGKENGSYAIAGHQSHVFGEYFNRLNELKPGNRFSFETADENIELEVFDRKIVRPDEVEVLNPQEGLAMVSLVTCYPENSSKYRLVVQAKRIN